MIEFQPADIVLVHSPGFNMLRLITGLYWNHVLLIDERIENDYGILESIAGGAKPRLLSTYASSELAVYRYIGITAEQQQNVRLAARELGGVRYDFLIPCRILIKVGPSKFVSLYIKFLTKQYPLEIPHIVDNFDVCSEYGQESYFRAKLPLKDNRWILLPDEIPMIDKLVLVWRGKYKTPA